MAEVASGYIWKMAVPARYHYLELAIVYRKQESLWCYQRLKGGAPLFAALCGFPSLSRFFGCLSGDRGT